MTTFHEADGRPWPRLYRLTIAQIMALPHAEREALFNEYDAFWLGRERGNTHPAPDHALQGVHYSGKPGGR